jgi:hypothetical protein
MYIKCNTVAYSHNDYTYLAILEQPSTTSSKIAHSLYLNVVSKNKTYLGLHVQHPIFLPDFNQIWNFSTDFHVSSQYQISQKYVQCEPHSYMDFSFFDAT